MSRQQILLLWGEQQFGNHIDGQPEFDEAADIKTLFQTLLGVLDIGADALLSTREFAAFEGEAEEGTQSKVV